MPVDYDLVILGGTVEGRTVAMTAAECGARVALVEPPGLFEQRQQARYLLQVLQSLGENWQRRAVGQWFSIGAHGALEDAALDWSKVLEWLAITTEAQTSLSPAVMSANGVDVVLELPLRLSKQLVVTTAERRLRSRAILAAFGRLPIDLAPLSQAKTLPKKVKITGGSPEAIFWAEALAELGTQVTLVAERFLLSVDEAIRQRVRLQLLVAGVAMLDQETLDQETIDTQRDEVSLAIDHRPPALELPSFVYWPAKRPFLHANRRLQTAHSRIFACGELLGGSTDLAIAEYEARVAVRNALFSPHVSVDYSLVAQAHRRFAQAGLTQAQAEQRYGRAVQVWASSHASATDLTRLIPSAEYCKLVCVSGRLVGVHLLGEGAGSFIGLFTTALGRPIESLKTVGLPVAHGSAQTLADLVSLAVEEARRSRWQIGQWRRDWAENWFNWRRSR
jgi:pyruvate/2-oxoglutarate dehydrogenase complex dihydrolipoamide dehydrogenase (E3) component